MLHDLLKKRVSQLGKLCHKLAVSCIETVVAVDWSERSVGVENKSIIRNQFINQKPSIAPTS